MHYAAWQYLSFAGEGSKAAGRYERSWREAKSQWVKASNREAGRQDLEENPYETTADKIQKELSGKTGGFLHIAGPDTVRRLND